MAYYIKENESFKASLLRITREQTLKASRAAHRDEDLHKAVHTTRKVCKKMRGVYRLFRKDLGERTYKEFNIRYRDVARKLSDIRDAQAMVETIDTILSKYHDYLTIGHTVEISEWLRRRQATIFDSRQQFESIVKGLIHELHMISDDANHVNLSTSQDFDVLYKSHKKVYKRGLKATKKAFATKEVADFHDLRKRAKYLWYHAKLLKNAWPTMQEARAKELHALSNYLGDDHDLMVLKDVLQKSPISKSPADYQLLEVIDYESEQLREKAYILAKKIFVEKPKKYTNRICQYWTNNIGQDALINTAKKPLLQQ